MSSSPAQKLKKDFLNAVNGFVAPNGPFRKLTEEEKNARDALRAALERKWATMDWQARRWADLKRPGNRNLAALFSDLVGGLAASDQRVLEQMKLKGGDVGAA